MGQFPVSADPKKVIILYIVIKSAQLKMRPLILIPFLFHGNKVHEQFIDLFDLPGGHFNTYFIIKHFFTKSALSIP